MIRHSRLRTLTGSLSKRAPLFFVLIGTIAAEPVGATTYVVQPDGSGDFPTIQAAINAAANGDVIELGDGVFQGAGNRGLDSLGKEIHIRSGSGQAANCIIDAENQGFGIQFFHWGGGPPPHPSLTDVTIRRSYGAVWDHTALAVTGCVLTANSLVGSFWGSTAVATACVIAGNSGALYVADSHVALNDCTIAFNPGGTVDVEHQAHVDADHTILAFNAGQGIFCGGTATAVLSCSDVVGNAGGDWVGCIAGQAGTNGNFSADPLFCSAPSGDYTISANSPCAPPGATGCGLVGALGVGCGPLSVDGATWGRQKSLFR